MSLLSVAVDVVFVAVVAGNARVLLGEVALLGDAGQSDRAGQLASSSSVDPIGPSGLIELREAA